MAMNMDAVLRIAAKVVGLDDLGALEKGLKGVESNAQAAGQGFKAMVNSTAWQGLAAAAAGLSVAIGLSVKEAISFESALNDVAKVVDGLDTPQGLKDIKQEIFALSREMPITQQGFAEMYAAAARAGVPKAELRDFAEIVANVAVAFDMTAGQAGAALAKIRTNLGLTNPELADLTDAMNHLTNSIGGSTPELVEFVLRSGAAGKQAGLSAEETAAFGAAMIASGAASEVASTSFGNMLKALSKGASMTDRQTSALAQLGYAQNTVEANEKKLTQAVEEESADRLKAIQGESKSVISEINKRYGQIQTIQQDNWEDEDRRLNREQEDRLKILRKRFDNQKEAEIRFSNERAKLNNSDNSAELKAIEEKYDERLLQMQRSLEDEKIEYERRQRDFRQSVKDQLEERKQMEMNAAQEKFDELKRIEELRKKQAIEDAKETAKAMVGELGPKMAKMLQEDAVGTIRDVFQRIKALPAEMQMSVISDLFGDEARALMPLINNTELLEKALGAVGDKSNYAGSTAAEYAKKLQTTASQLQLFQNGVTELAIVLGESYLPAIRQALALFAPLIKGFSWLIEEVPILGPIIAGLSAAFVALVAAAPFISAFITLLGQLTPLATAIGAAWAGLQTVFIVAFQGILTWLGGTFIPTLLAFFSGPVGWTVLAIAAVVAMAIAFREPLMGFVKWLWKWGEPIRKFWTTLWDDIVELVTTSLKTTEKLIDTWWDNVKKVWKGIAGFVDDKVAKPVRNTWKDLMQNLQKGVKSYFDWWRKNWNSAADVVEDVFEKVVKAIETPIKGIALILANTLRAAFRTLENAFNGFVLRYNNLIAEIKNTPFRGILGLLPTIPFLKIPGFAQGGLVTGPTVAMIGEGGEDEFVLPRSMLQKHLQELLQQARDKFITAPRLAQHGAEKKLVDALNQLRRGPINEKTIDEMKKIDAELKRSREAFNEAQKINQLYVNQAQRRLEESFAKQNDSDPAINRMLEITTRLLSEQLKGGSFQNLPTTIVNPAIELGQPIIEQIEPVTSFINEANAELGKGLTTVASQVKDLTADHQDAIGEMRKDATAFFKWYENKWDDLSKLGETSMKKVGDTAATVFAGVTSLFAATIRGVLTYIVNGFNDFILKANNILGQMRTISPLMSLISQVPNIKPLTVPQFAQGGIVTGPTVALVGEGGQDEFIIPRSTMERQLRDMIGANMQNNGGSNTVVKPVITINTGPVVEINGQQYVTIEELQAAMETTAKAMYQSLRSPATRIQFGIA